MFSSVSIQPFQNNKIYMSWLRHQNEHMCTKGARRECGTAWIFKKFFFTKSTSFNGTWQLLIAIHPAHFKGLKLYVVHLLRGKKELFYAISAAPLKLVSPYCLRYKILTHLVKIEPVFSRRFSCEGVEKRVCVI